jgi:hypothetical protein
LHHGPEDIEFKADGQHAMVAGRENAASNTGAIALALIDGTLLRRAVGHRTERTRPQKGLRDGHARAEVLGQHQQPYAPDGAVVEGLGAAIVYHQAGSPQAASVLGVIDSC